MTARQPSPFLPPSAADGAASHPARGVRSFMYRLQLATGAYDHLAPGLAEFLDLPAEALRAPGGSALVEPRIHPDDLALRQAALAGAKAHTTLELDWRLHLADGDYCPVHETVTVFRDQSGDAGHAVGVLLPLGTSAAYRAAAQRLEADRCVAEARLQDSESRYALAMRGTNEGLWDWNPVTDELFLSSRVLTVLGIDGDHIRTTSREWLKRVHHEDRPLFRTVLVDHLKGLTPHFETEYRLLDHHGNYRWVLARGLAQRDARGLAYRMVGSIGDITDRKEAEAALRTLNKELESRVAARTAELAAALKELEAFSYSVSHDLRAPLRAIDGYSAILANELGDQLDDDSRELLQRMRSAVQRMGELIDDLLDLARVSRQTLHREKVDLSALVKEITQHLAHGQPDREVEIDIEPGLCAWVDPKLIRIALENLLNNAWKFTARQSAPRVKFHSACGDGDELAFCVEDNGAGFDMRYVHKLFGAFQRLHHARDFPGTGIGLATVARIIQRHGGRVWAQGTPGVGARFCFTIPPPEAQAGAPA